MILPGRDLVVMSVAITVAILWYADHQRLTARYATDMKRMQDAGVDALAKRQETISDLRSKSRADADRIDRLSADNRVRCYSEPRVPTNRGGADPDPPSNDRGARDTTEILKQCLKTFGEVNRALEAK